LFAIALRAEAVEKAAVSYWLLAVGYGAAPAMPFQTRLIGVFNLLRGEWVFGHFA